MGIYKLELSTLPPLEPQRSIIVAKGLKDVKARMISLKNIARILAGKGLINEALKISEELKGSIWYSRALRTIVLALLERNPEDALFYLSMIKDEEDLSLAIYDILSTGSRDINVDQILSLAENIKDGRWRNIVLLGLAKYFASINDINNIYMVIKDLSPQRLKALALSDAALMLPDDLKVSLFREAISLCRNISNQYCRDLFFLCVLINMLHANLIEDSMVILNNISSDEIRALALICIIRNCDDEQTISNLSSNLLNIISRLDKYSSANVVSRISNITLLKTVSETLFLSFYIKHLFKNYTDRPLFSIPLFDIGYVREAVSLAKNSERIAYTLLPLGYIANRLINTKFRDEIIDLIDYIKYSRHVNRGDPYRILMAFSLCLKNMASNGITLAGEIGNLDARDYAYMCVSDALSSIKMYNLSLNLSYSIRNPIYLASTLANIGYYMEKDCVDAYEIFNRALFVANNIPELKIKSHVKSEIALCMNRACYDSIEVIIGCINDLKARDMEYVISRLVKYLAEIELSACNFGVLTIEVPDNVSINENFNLKLYLQANTMLSKVIIDLTNLSRNLELEKNKIEILNLSEGKIREIKIKCKARSRGMAGGNITVKCKNRIFSKSISITVL